MHAPASILYIMWVIGFMAAAANTVCMAAAAITVSTWHLIVPLQVCRAMLQQKHVTLQQSTTGVHDSAHATAATLRPYTSGAAVAS
jgi:hypothetical protein